MSSTKFVFFGPIGKTRWLPWPLIGWDIFDFSFETTERNLTKLDRKQDLNVLYQVCVFRADPKNKMATLASCWDIFDFSYDTAERNLTKLDRKQDLNVLYEVCIFRADRRNKLAALASDWLRHFPLKPLNGLQRNLTISKISTSSTKFVFLGLIEKTRWPPWPIRQKGGTLYSGARYVALWASCLVHLSQRLKCTIVITRCLLSICLSVRRRPSVVNFHIFDFFFETSERNSTKLDRKQDHNIL